MLRQLADGVARDVRARRNIEAERAEARQSIRMLLADPGRGARAAGAAARLRRPLPRPAGQLVMALLLAGTLGLLVWMRRLALGRPAPRFLSDTPNERPRWITVNTLLLAGLAAEAAELGRGGIKAVALATGVHPGHGGQGGAGARGRCRARRGGCGRPAVVASRPPRPIRGSGRR